MWFGRHWFELAEMCERDLVKVYSIMTTITDSDLRVLVKPTQSPKYFYSKILLVEKQYFAQFMA